MAAITAVILEPKKIKFVTTYTFPPPICHEGPDAMIWAFAMFTFKLLSFFVFGLRACRILDPQPGIEPALPAVEV